MVNFGPNSAMLLAQLNLGTNAASLLGIFLAVAGAGLYFLRSFRPELSTRSGYLFCRSRTLVRRYSFNSRMATRSNPAI
ncbi:MAG: Ycf66 family protein [Potamolinea sp.]